MQDPARYKLRPGAGKLETCTYRQVQASTDKYIQVPRYLKTATGH